MPSHYHFGIATGLISRFHLIAGLFDLPQQIRLAGFGLAIGFDLQLRLLIQLSLEGKNIAERQKDAAASRRSESREPQVTFNHLRRAFIAANTTGRWDKSLATSSLAAFCMGLPCAKQPRSCTMAISYQLGPHRWEEWRPAEECNWIGENDGWKDKRSVYGRVLEGVDQDLSNGLKIGPEAQNIGVASIFDAHRAIGFHRGWMTAANRFKPQLMLSYR